ncbi:MAG: hypothetical protein LBG80_20850 [Bacteroidales bacterium]|jgi:hypothetical protein|nr:hypothetical protein [Bacteroidales bacterium]
MRKKYIVLIFGLVISSISYSQTGLSLTVGYSPFQTLESDGIIKKDGQTIHADLQVCSGFYDIIAGIGIIGGVGLRSYNTDGFNTYSSNPYKKRTTRFDIHLGPALRIGDEDLLIGVLIHPQIGWGFGGYRDLAPKSYFAFTLNADILIVNWITIGATYRPLSHTITSSASTLQYQVPPSTYHLVKPSWEFRVGLFHLFD